MSNWQDILKKKPLVGGQKELDKDKDGDIDGEDFELMSKMTFDEAEEKANKIMMEKYNPKGMAGVSMDWATIHDGKSKEYSKLIQSFMKENN